MGSCTSNQNVKDSTKHPRKDEAKQENQPGHTALPLPSQPAKPSVSSEDLSNFPDFFYLDRAKGSLYQITKSQSTEFPLKSRFNLPQDSALTALPNGLLMSVGGLVKQSLVKLVYTIDLQSKVVSELPDLPFPCKLGQLHPIGDFVYFIGGVKNGKTDLQQAPLMRYNFRLSFWEDLWKYGEQFQFDRIVNMGTCAFGSKICLIGGQKINSSGLLRNNKKIYSVDVEDGFKVQLEEKIPFKVIRPVIANGRKNAVVTGGVDPKTGKSNRGSFLLISQNSGLKIVKINDVGFDLKESYPAIYEQDTVIFISRPFIAVRIKKINNWIAFEITGKDTRRALAVVKVSQLKMLRKLTLGEKDRFLMKNMSGILRFIVNRLGKVLGQKEILRGKMKGMKNRILTSRISLKLKSLTRRTRSLMILINLGNMRKFRNLYLFNYMIRI
jgi:hypothetical protein